jgi:hypothetical protein
MTAIIYKMLSREARLEHELTRLREDIDAEWQRLKSGGPPGLHPIIDAQEIRASSKSKAKGNDRKSDLQFLLEMARRLEQDRNLKPWPVALRVAASRPNSLAWNASWTSIDPGPYLKTTAKRIYRKFQKESGRRHRCLYLICVSSSENRNKVSKIVANHKERIGKASILEEDISDDYLEELRSAVAEDVRRDRESELNPENETGG